MAHPIHEAIRRLRERHQQNHQQMQLNEGQIAASNCFDQEREDEIAAADVPVLATAGLRSKDFEPEKIIRDQAALFVEKKVEEVTEEKYRTIEAYIKTYLHVTGADIRMLRLCERTSYRDGKIVIERWLEPR